MKPILIYTTVPTHETGASIAKALLDCGLIACANLLAPHTSFHRWDGKLQTSQEHILLLKSIEGVEQKIYHKIKTLHSYDCPAIFTLPITAMDDAFEKWLSAEIRG